jgi:prepilin-type N-terminal cleavage/methylation domain-containing protein
MKRAFTLVEMAIVLVAIGLIVGMALRGKTLLDSATVRSEVSKLSTIQSAVATLLVSTSADGTLNDLPKEFDIGGYNYIDLLTLTNRGLLGTKDITSVEQKFMVYFCASINGNAAFDFDTGRKNNTLCVRTPNVWPYRYTCTAELILDDQNIKSGKGRISASSAATNQEVGGIVSISETFNCVKSQKLTSSYDYTLLSNKITK